MCRFRSQILIAALVLIVCRPVQGQERDRSKIPDKYKWNLAEIYPTDEAWGAAKDKLKGEISKIGRFKGTLGESPQSMFTALDSLSKINKEFVRVFVYASMSSDQDTRDSKYQAMRQEMGQIGTTFGAESSFLEPEILAIDQTKVMSFLKDEPKLEVYRFYLTDLFRRNAHTGSAAEEKIIADAGLMTNAGTIFGIFSNADFAYPTVTLSDGSSVLLDQAAFGRYRAVANREDRKKVMAAFFGQIGKFRNTFGSSLSAKVNEDMFYMRARKYGTTLEASLDANNIPTSVYRSLVDGVNANLPTFHRYLQLRKRMLGVDQLHYYDLYAPLVSSVDTDYPVEEAQKHILRALEPLGADYKSVLQRAFNERWLDMYPNTGKRSGAYSNGGAYDVHPYMLLNYNGKYNDMSTLAHELGHTMQSYYSNKTQAYPNAGYPTFVAEVASTFNEALLVDYMMKTMKTDAEKLALLGNYVEGAKGTLFRQTQFAEFELRMHEIAESGKPLTGEVLDNLYMEITKKYYGHDKGVCIVDDEIAHEWAYIPHFYGGYYVFQYSTSFTASQALSENVLAGDKAAIKRFLTFISAGGSKYPIDLLKDAGVDMTTTEPLELTIRKLNRAMDDMEKILTRMGK